MCKLGLSELAKYRGTSVFGVSAGPAAGQDYVSYATLMSAWTGINVSAREL